MQKQKTLLQSKLDEEADLPRIIAAEKKIISKSGRKFRRKSPWLFSVISICFAIISLPFWSDEEYRRGYRKGVLLAAHDRGVPGVPVKFKHHNIKNCCIVTMIGAFIGLVVGVILVFYGSSFVSLWLGSVIGASVTLYFTIGTYIQMDYYKDKGVKEGKCQFNLQFDKILHSYHTTPITKTVLQNIHL